MRTRISSQAEVEIIRFLAAQPTPEQIIAFHPSPEVAERAYDLLHTERDRELTDEGQEEIDR